MLSSVLRSARAVEVNIAIMRTFVQLRRLMDSNRDLASKIDALERKYDEQFSVVFAAIKELIARLRHSGKRSDFIRENCRTAPSSSLPPRLPPSAFRIPHSAFRNSSFPPDSQLSTTCHAEAREG